MKGYQKRDALFPGLVLTVGWVIIYIHLLKIHNLILQTNKSFRHFISLTMSQMKKIKLESRNLEERRDVDYIHEPMKLLKFSYSCLIPQPFHPVPKPNLNFKLIWDSLLEISQILCWTYTDCTSLSV